MPEMDGLTLAKKLNENSKFKDIKMIAITSAYDIENDARQQALGLAGYHRNLYRRQNCFKQFL